MIHALGDSHAAIFGGLYVPPIPMWPEWMTGIPGQRAGHLGPALALKLAEEGYWGRRGLWAALSDVPQSDPVILSFGEIDCRILRSKAMVAEAAFRYFSVALTVRAAGWRPALWGVIGSARDGVHTAADYPAEGTCQERNARGRVFNDTLRELCKGSGILFLSIFDATVGADGLTVESYLGPDRMHLGPEALPLIQTALDQLGEPKGIHRD